MSEKIKSFTDLTTWQEGHNLVLMTYKCIENFPKKENFAIIPQMQRCAISITSNIAEGFSRKSSKEKIQFYYISLGSLTELHNQFIIAKGLNYLELRNAFMVFSPNLEGENLIEFQNIASYVLELLRIFNPNLEKRPETCSNSGIS